MPDEYLKDIKVLKWKSLSKVSNKGVISIATFSPAFYENKLDENLKLNEDLKNCLDKIEKKNAHDFVENKMRISDIAEKNSAFEARFEAIDGNIEGQKHLKRDFIINLNTYV